MPLMVLSHRTLSFVYTDIRSLSNLKPTVQRPCWGWGILAREPVKYYERGKDADGKSYKYLAVRTWLGLGTDSKGVSQGIRLNIYGVYAEGCQYLEQGDPIHFEGTLLYDKYFSKKLERPYWMVDATMVIPPYSADGREFCARRNAIREMQNAEMISRYTDMTTGEFLPGLSKLEEHLKGERDGSKENV